MRNGSLVFVGLVGMMISACGGGEDAAMPGTVSSVQAQSAVSGSVMLRSAVDTMEGAQIAAAVLQVNASTSGIVTPQGAGTTKGLTSENVETVTQAQTSGMQSCTAAGCTFTDYSTGGSTLNGRVDVADAGDGAKSIKWDLTIEGSGLGAAAGGFGFNYNAKGDVTVSMTALNGEVHTVATVSGSNQGQSYEGGYTADVRYQSIVLSNGKPTGGSIWAKVTSTGSSGGQTQSQAYEGTHTFN